MNRRGWCEPAGLADSRFTDRFAIHVWPSRTYRGSPAARDDEGGGRRGYLEPRPFVSYEAADVSGWVAVATECGTLGDTVDVPAGGTAPDPGEADPDVTC